MTFELAEKQEMKSKTARLCKKCGRTWGEHFGNVCPANK
jgi:hypothetical protein